MRRLFILVVCLLPVTWGCSPARQYELTGQVVAVDRVRQEITVTHQDIRGFMPGMTMPFKVRDPQLLERVVPGDLVKATLVVREVEGYLSSIERTGRAALTEPAQAPAMDVMEPGAAVPDVTLTDSAGTTRRFSDWRGHVLALTFTYTRCPLPDFCPRMDRHFEAVQHQVAADPLLRDRVRLLTVSFDPDYDRPAVLAEHARRVGADPAIWTLATAEADAVRAFASRFGVSVIRENPSPDIVHNLRTAVIGPDGRLRQVFTGNDWTPEALVAAIRNAG